MAVETEIKELVTQGYASWFDGINDDALKAACLDWSIPLSGSKRYLQEAKGLLHEMVRGDLPSPLVLSNERYKLTFHGPIGTQGNASWLQAPEILFQMNRLNIPESDLETFKLLKGVERTFASLALQYNWCPINYDQVYITRGIMYPSLPLEPNPNRSLLIPIA